MTETTLQIISSLKILAIGVFATLYGFGGMSGKWKRRIIGSVVATAGICGFSLWTGSFSYWYLLCALLLFASLSIGYGADDTATKILKRSRYGLACATATLPVFIVQQAWTLLALHLLICIATSTVCGVWNETPSARAEETLIGASIVLVPLFTI